MLGGQRDRRTHRSAAHGAGCCCHRLSGLSAARCAAELASVRVFRTLVEARREMSTGLALWTSSANRYNPPTVWPSSVTTTRCSGVGREATDEEIKRAFRRPRSVITPTSTAATAPSERFKELNEAYRVLSDRQRRTAYDMFGHAGVDASTAAGGFEGFGGGFGPFGDIFDAFFGGSAGRRAPARPGGRRRGPALRPAHRVRRGDQRSDAGDQLPDPGDLHGVRRERRRAGNEPERCPECNGTGEKRRVAQTILGQMVNIVACPRCNGEGRIIAQPCHRCAGDGRVREERTIEVAVPAGIDSGQRIALEGQGEAGPRGGPPGDLYVAVSVARPSRARCVAGRSSTTSCRSRFRRPRWAPRWRFPRPRATRSCPFPPERRAGRSSAARQGRAAPARERVAATCTSS